MMMKRTFAKIVVMLSIFTVVLSTSVKAMESETKSQVRGIVVDITPNAIVVQEVRKEGNEISQFELTINEKTRFSDKESGEIALGDAVEIEFSESEEGKIALMIQQIKAMESAEKAGKDMLKADLDIDLADR
ncbi:MAG: hypothetical protein K8I00_09530 [Candidatus Omnitrophica bacterium]|nr:hypothetical protein [Candidatus Omnitrophota bacterium]